MRTLTYAERIAAWRQENPDKQLTYKLLLEICDATDLTGAGLPWAYLEGADLRGAKLMGAHLVYANLRGANLWGADLAGADLAGANLTGAKLRGADLAGANLRGANLWGANLWGADLAGADLAGAKLRGADLAGANLTVANLWGADLLGANLRGADLWGANLSGANLRGADLWGANLMDADLWAGFQITGLPSGQVALTPTPDGWELRVGCWHGTIDDLRNLIAQDDGWPEAEGEEITRRRPGLQAALALIDAHIALRPNVINELKTKWGTSEGQPF